MLDLDEDRVHLDLDQLMQTLLYLDLICVRWDQTINSIWSSLHSTTTTIVEMLDPDQLDLNLARQNNIKKKSKAK